MTITRLNQSRMLISIRAVLRDGLKLSGSVLFGIWESFQVDHLHGHGIWEHEYFQLCSVSMVLLQMKHLQ
jgi:hypothetical protein